ncbi:MAG: TPM domain-containing protein, partial [Casimicrobiaceae bacterium]
MRALWRRVCRACIAGTLLAAFAAAGAADVPYLTGRVVDNAEILKPATRERVAALAKAHEDKTADQIAVLTVPTLGGESIEEYAGRVFAAWKLGQKGKDNGVLVVVAPKDHKMRIEVGYGLEGTLPDVAASRIIRNVM